MNAVSQSSYPDEGVVASALLDLYFRLCEKHGIARKALLDASGVANRDINPPDGWVKQAVMERLFNARLDFSDDPVLGIHFATDLNPYEHSIGLLGFVCMSCPSIQDLHYSLVNFGRLVSNIFSTSLVHQPGGVLWCIDLLYREERLIRDNVEWFLGSSAQMVHRMDRTALKAVHLAHKPVLVNGAPHPHYAKAFPCPIYFEQERSALLLDPQSLNRQTATGDTTAFNALSIQAQELVSRMGPQLHLIDRVKQEILSLLQRGNVSREETCKRLGLSSRHLHRQLQAYNSSYQALLDDIRAEHALKALAETDVELEVLSAKLCFSSAKSFSRWFHNRFHVTPGSYRRNILM